jgi:hypothetical protein
MTIRAECLSGRVNMETTLVIPFQQFITIKN